MHLVLLASGGETESLLALRAEHENGKMSSFVAVAALLFHTPTTYAGRAGPSSCCVSSIIVYIVYYSVSGGAVMHVHARRMQNIIDLIIIAARATHRPPRVRCALCACCGVCVCWLKSS